MTSLSDLDLVRLGLRPDALPERTTAGDRLAGLRSWTADHAASLSLVAAVSVVAATVMAWNLGGSPALFDDEGTYVAQAWAVQHRGALAHYTYWYDHPPLGWIQLALWGWLTGATSRPFAAIEGGRQLMLLAHLASGGLLFLLARRLQVSRVAATVALVLFSFSPLALAYGRMVFLDNLAVAWLLAAFVLAASPQTRLWAFAAAGACAAMSVLTKETFVLLLPFVVWQLWSSADPRTRRFCLTAFAATFALLAVGYPLFALLKGELLPSDDRVSLFNALRFQLSDRASSGSMLDAGSNSRELLSGWLELDPWLLAVGVALAPVALVVRRLRPTAAALLALTVFSLRDGYLPTPYVVVLLPFAALVIASVGDAAWHRRAEGGRAARALGASLRVAVLAGVVLAGAAVVPDWVDGDHRLMTADDSASLIGAERWLAANADPDSRIMVDDASWVDLVEAGFEDDLGVVWFYKLDFPSNADPGVTDRLPEGWRHFDYVLSTPFLRTSLLAEPDGFVYVNDTLDNSFPIVTFGTGEDRVEVRRVVGGLGE